ncbi:MAG: hypothetical protein KF699_03145 [Phycisphaeraceae bacterium]|nr:hypothetical protein [Phycisphaeraceae bacterium]
MRDFDPSTPDSRPDFDEGFSDVPGLLEVLPDGREVVVFGDHSRLADFCHPQGDNSYGFKGTCGLCSASGVLCQFGFPATEQYVVAWAVEHGRCDVSADSPQERGGTTVFDQREILVSHGLPTSAKVEQSLEDLADAVQDGRGVIAEVNAGVLWNDAAYFDSGGPNHAITVTGVARDPADGSLVGFYLNDSGTGRADQFVTATTLTDAWANAGGVMVVTDVGSQEYSLA